MTQIKIPYTNHKYLLFKVPQHYRVNVCEPRASMINEQPKKLIIRALDNPLKSLRLEERVKPGDKVLIVCDDLTRPTPADKLLPPILDRLNQAGVPDGDIEVLFALGTHRSMTLDEKRAKVGAKVIRRVACYNHNAYDKSALDYFGESKEGIPVWLNKRLREASFIIGIGDLVPHPIGGFAGGAKLLYPGVAGEETIAGFHVSFGLDPSNYYGSFSAPARTSINHLADVVGLDFLVNTVLSRGSQIHTVLAGDYITVYEQGIKISRKIYGVPVNRLYDVVVVSSYPAWIEFWQGGKGIYAGATLATPGGEIILASACPEGAARTHPDYARCIGMNPEDVANLLAQGEFEDPIGAAIAIKVARIRENYNISLVSDGLSQAEVDVMGFQRYDCLEDALSAALERKASQSEIGVIPYGGHTYCFLADE